MPLRNYEPQIRKNLDQSFNDRVYSPPVALQSRNIGASAFISTDSNKESINDQKGEKDDHSINVSPYKRKIVDREYLTNVSNKAFVQSHGMAENLKKLINSEIEAFKKECDNVKRKINDIKNVGSEGSTGGKHQDSLGLKERNSTTSEQALKTITNKFDKLIMDIGDRAVSLSSNTKGLKERLSASGRNTQREQFGEEYNRQTVREFQSSPDRRAKHLAYSSTKRNEYSFDQN